jgi:hypothetical protein
VLQLETALATLVTTWFTLVTKKTLLPVSQHFVSPGHSLDDFGRSKIDIIAHNPSWKENQRQNRESFWIRELQTLHPEGINKTA